MSQLALDLLSDFPPRIENFVPGPNDEVLALLQALADAPAGAPGERQVHLWGPPGSGKSHLLQALAERLGVAARLIGPDAPPSAYGFSSDEPPLAADPDAPAGTPSAEAQSAGIAPAGATAPRPGQACADAPPAAAAPEPAGAAAPPRIAPAQLRLDLGLPAPWPAWPTSAAIRPSAAMVSTPAAPPHAGPPRLWLVDDVQALDDARQQALFGLINRVRAQPGAAVVTAADAPPLGLTLREDLRTRLGWGRVLGLKPLTDEDKALALLALAARRGVAMSDEVPAWLLAHSSRDMRALIALFDELDRHALARQRAITLPLLRDYLQREL